MKVQNGAPKRIAGIGSRRWSIPLGLCTCLAAGPAQADGVFFQFDTSSSTTSAVFNMARGPYSFGAIAIDYDGGQSFGLNAVYQLPWGSDIATLRLGPSIGLEREDDGTKKTRFGAKFVAERYQATSYGSLFLLADLNSIENSWFVLAKFDLSDPGIAVEISRGASNTYQETTLAVARQLGDTPFHLRAGYRFDAKEAFAGLAINTF